MTPHARVAQFWRPRRIALIGASDDPAKTSGRPQRYLLRHGYGGEVWPVNPGRAQVQGVPAVPSIAELPEGIDHAYVLLPTEGAVEAVQACGAAGIPFVTVLAGNFAEAGAEGRARQAELLAVAREHGMRLLGPNSMGVINVTDRVALSVNAALDAPALKPGPIGVISQSGSLLGTLISRGQARGFGFSKLVSIGNEADLGVGDIGSWLVDDAATRAILLFLETIRDGEAMAAMARRAAEARKPVLAFAPVRSDTGRTLATSHTGALAGSDEAIDAFFRDAGILRVDLLEAFLEMAPLAMGRQPPMPPSRRVAVMTTTGGGAAMVVDRLALGGLTIAPPPDAVVEGLAADGIDIGRGPLTDLTMAGARADLVSRVLGALLASPDCDAVVAVVGSSAQFHADTTVAPLIEHARSAKPFGVFLAPDAPQSLARLADAGVPAFRTPESCAEAFVALFRWSAPRPSRPAASGNLTEVARRIEAGSLDERAALEVFAALGIDHAQGIVLDAETPDLAAIDFYPVVAKVSAADIAHKADVGGVVTDIADASALARAHRLILEEVARARPEVKPSGILVQRFEPGLAEVIVGYRVDPAAGPLVLVGMGGALAELWRDFAVRCAPVTNTEARSMIEEVRGMALLKGFRGRTRGDLEALAGAIAALSQLAHLPAGLVAEAEINPLIVKERGVVAVDGLIVRPVG